MAKFSQSSMSKLSTCDVRLQILFNEIIKHRDCTIIIGYRDKAQQDEAFAKQRSRVSWPNSKHNSYPSKAVDVAPWPTVWPDKVADPKQRELVWREWYMFVGLVRGVAAQLGINIRCGADWDGDYEIKDQNFHDLPHFEIKE